VRGLLKYILPPHVKQSVAIEVDCHVVPCKLPFAFTGPQGG